MPDLVTLSCPTCGGKLQITDDIHRFACSHCGNEHIVNRSGGIVSISPVVEGLSKVQAGVDKTAAELAIRRLREDLVFICVDRKKLEQALLKAKSDAESIGITPSRAIELNWRGYADSCVKLLQLTLLIKDMEDKLDEQMRIANS
jgi:primosomal protein N'